jgi:hypothetical protein
MLGAVSWGTFLGFLFMVLLVYYGYVCWKFGLVREWLTRRGAGPPADVDGDDAMIGGEFRGESAEPAIRDEPGMSSAVGRNGVARGDVAAGGGMVVAGVNGPIGTGVVGETAAPVGMDALGATPVYPVGKQMPLGLMEFSATGDAGAQADMPAKEKGGSADPDGVGRGGLSAGAGMQDANVELLKIAESLIGGLQSLVQEAAVTQLARPELERRVGALLKANRGLIGTSCQASIESFLERSSRMHLRYVLAQADIQRLWGIGSG